MVECSIKWVSDAFDLFVEAGYTITSAYTVVKDPDVKFVYRDALWGGADMLGTGVASFGHIGGVHVQNEHDIGTYLERVTNNEFPIYRAYPINDDETLIREFILQLKLGEVNLNYFKDKFDEDIAKRFSNTLQLLKNDDYLTYSTNTIKLSRDGLLQIDRLIHEFFLAEHQNARYA